MCLSRARLRKAMTLADAQEQQQDICVYLYIEICLFATNISA